jgi:hypothetical protein
MTTYDEHDIRRVTTTTNFSKIQLERECTPTRRDRRSRPGKRRVRRSADTLSSIITGGGGFLFFSIIRDLRNNITKVWRVQRAFVRMLYIVKPIRMCATNFLGVIFRSFFSFFFCSPTVTDILLRSLYGYVLYECFSSPKVLSLRTSTRWQRECYSWYIHGILFYFITALNNLRVCVERKKRGKKPNNKKIVINNIIIARVGTKTAVTALTFWDYDGETVRAGLGGRNNIHPLTRFIGAAAYLYTHTHTHTHIRKKFFSFFYLYYLFIYYYYYYVRVLKKRSVFLAFLQ